MLKDFVYRNLSIQITLTDISILKFFC